MKLTASSRPAAVLAAACWAAWTAAGAAPALAAPSGSPARADAAGPSGPAPSVRTFDLGFLASRQVDLDGRVRLRGLGPFLEWTRGSDGYRFEAVRPLLTSTEYPESGWHRWDVLWPVGSAKRLEDREFGWRVVLAYGQRFDLKDPRSRYRIWVLPIYFQGRDAQKRPYLAIFPLGGSVHEFFGQDVIDFALFPLWARSRQKDLRTWDVLWPILSRTRGPGVDRFRVFPLYGRSTRAGQYDKQFVLWPFYSQSRYHYRHSSGLAYLVFPLWGHSRLTDQDSWMFLPPFFRVDHGQQLRGFTAPWPFVQYRRGVRNRFYLWPLFGRVRRPSVETAFLLWPIGWRERIDRGDVLLTRYKVLPFYQYEERRAPEPGPDGRPDVRGRHLHLWPLLSYGRDDDLRTVRALDLWPVKNTAPVERSWAPFWTLFEHRQRGGDCDTEFLWGLYRFTRRGDATARTSFFPVVEWAHGPPAAAGGAGRRSWSLLKGLVGYRRSDTNRAYRVLWFLRFGNGEHSP